MARVIAEAAIRLVADRKGLGNSIRREFRAAVKEAMADSGMFKDVEKQSDTSSKKVRKVWQTMLSGLQTTILGVLSGVGSIGKLLTIGVVAAGAIAGVTQLTVALGALSGALLQAAGVAGLLPAALAGFLAIKGTLALGLSGISDGFKAVGEDAATFNEAIKNLAPNAQAFLKEIRNQKKAFDQLRLDVQERLFFGLADAAKQLGATYLPIANRLFVAIAGSLNNAARQVTQFALSGQTVGKVNGITDNLRNSINSLSGAIAPVVAAFVDITSVGSTFLPGISNTIKEAAVRFAEFIRASAESGRLQQFFQNAIDTLKQLGRIIANVFGAFGNIMDAARAQGAGFLSTLEAITAKFKEFTGSAQGQTALQSFFASMQRVVAALGPAFFELITVIGRDLLPILADIAVIIGPVLRPLFEALGQLLQALRPVIDALAKAFAKVLAALQPFFEALGNAIQDALPTLIPLIDDIGQAFADLVTALVPLAPLFVQLLTVLLPLLPPFIQMVVDLMPQFISLIQALIPLLQGIVDVLVAAIPIFTDIANVILTVVIPVINALSFVIGGLFTVISVVFSAIWNTITTVFGAIGDYFSTIWTDITDTFSTAMDAISGIFDGGINGMVSTLGGWVQSVIDGVANAMASFAKGIQSGITTGVQWFGELPGKIAGFFADAGSWLINAGKQIIQGLINGLKSAAGAVINFFKNLISNAVGSVTDFLGISSPSRVFHEIGENIGLGLIQGLSAITPAVADAATSMAGVATEGFTNPLATASTATAGAVGGLGTTVINQTNVMRQGTDIKQFSDLVLGRTMGDLLSGASTLTVARNGVQAGVNDQWVGA